MSLIERGAYSNVIAKYRDKSKSEEVEVTASEGEPVYTFSKLFKDEAEATKAANTQFEAFQRGKSKVNLELPDNPSFMAEAALNLSGFRDGVNGTWVVESTTHSLSNNGYTVSLEAVVKKAKWTYL